MPPIHIVGPFTRPPTAFVASSYRAAKERPELVVPEAGAGNAPYGSNVGAKGDDITHARRKK